MEYGYKYRPTEKELIEIRNTRIAHAIFLKAVQEDFDGIAEKNNTIFRRKPESRLKSTNSIIRNYDIREDKFAEFIPFVNNLKDIAGLRLTITTKDEFEIARHILSSSELIKKHGVLDTNSRPGNGIMNKRGYAAHHYYLISTVSINSEIARMQDVVEKTLKSAGVSKEELGAEYRVTLEIQVRTLAQDLWAVFEHPERYKGNETSSKLLDDELLNYARLMDVADDLAQLTKNRKIYEAEEYFLNKRNAPVEDHKLLTINTLRREISLVLKSINGQMPIVLSTSELCDLLKLFADNGIFTIEDCNSLVRNQTYKKRVLEICHELDIIWEQMDVSVLDTFRLFFICRKSQLDCENIRIKKTNSDRDVENRLRTEMVELKDRIIKIMNESLFKEILNSYDYKEDH